MSQNPKPSFTDVLVIGAGPSGLMAAQALARLGVKVRVIERRRDCSHFITIRTHMAHGHYGSDPRFYRQKGSQYGNADGLIPRLIEIFKSYDMLDEFLAGSNRMYSIVSTALSQCSILVLLGRRSHSALGPF